MFGEEIDKRMENVENKGINVWGNISELLIACLKTEIEKGIIKTLDISGGNRSKSFMKEISRFIKRNILIFAFFIFSVIIIASYIVTIS